MKRTQASIILTILSIPTISGQTWKSPNFLSFFDAGRDCAEYLLLPNDTIERINDQRYPNEPVVRQMVNCVLVNLQALDNDVIKDHVIKSFFNRSSSEVGGQYDTRTRNCLQSISVSEANEKFERPFRAFLCYYDYYGTLLPEEKRFVPYESTELRKLLRQSISIDNTTCRALMNFSSGDFVTRKEKLESLLWTFSVRSGFYDRQHGPYLERLYAQFANPDLVSVETRQCVDVALLAKLDEPERFYQMFEKCLRGKYPFVELLQAEAKVIVQTQMSSCSCCLRLVHCKRCKRIHDALDLILGSNKTKIHDTDEFGI